MYCFIVSDVRFLENKSCHFFWRVARIRFTFFVSWTVAFPGSRKPFREGVVSRKGDVTAELLDGLDASPHMWRASCLARRSRAAASTRASRALRPRPTPQSARALAGGRRAEHRRTAWTPTSSSTSGAMSTRAVGSEASTSSSPDDATSWTGGSPDSLAAWLRAHGVDPGFASAANDTKSISELATEVRRGETTLAADANGAVRRVRVLRLLIRDDRDRVLIEARQEWSDGRVRERGTPLSEKMHRDEDWRDAARRAVVEELGSRLFFLTKDPARTATPDTAVVELNGSGPGDESRLTDDVLTLDESSVAFVSITKSTSASYPGLRSAYDFVTVDARVRGLPECDETFVSRFRTNDDASYEAEPSFTSTERDADGTTLVATWVWREGYVVDDGT